MALRTARGNTERAARNRPPGRTTKLVGWSQVTVKGQVTIPAAIREKLSIRPGDSVSFRLESDGSLVLARVKPLSTLFEEVDQRVPIGDWRRFKADVEEEAAGEKLRKAEKPD